MQEHPSNRQPASPPARWKDQANNANSPSLDAGFADSEISLEFLAEWDSRRNSLSASPISGKDPKADAPFSPPLPGNCLWMESIAERDVSGVDSELPASGIFSSFQQMPPSALSGACSSPEFAESLQGLLHDARNLVTTLDLYCDLLDTPGVLEPPSHHYAGELRHIANSSRRILEKLAARAARENESFPDAEHPIDRPLGEATTLQVPEVHSLASDSRPPNNPDDHPGNSRPSSYQSDNYQSGNYGPENIDARRLYHERALTLRAASANRAIDVDPQSVGAFQRISDTVESLARGPRWRPFVAAPPIQNLAEEVLANHNLLCGLAGPGITVGLSLYDGKRPVPLCADDLTRILVNLVKNASEAMPQGGHIQVALEEFADHLSLSVSDTGVGIPDSALEAIFTAGFTNRVAVAEETTVRGGWPAPLRGMGLAIVRSIMSGAGGSVTAANRRDGPVALLRETGEGGARASSALPVSGAVFRLRFPLPS